MQIDPSQKLSGVLVPVFALRSKDDLGVGDTESVREMIDWCAQHRFSLLQVLPVNETSDDNSPYNAISSMALDPTTIAVSPKAVPDLPLETFRKLAPADALHSLRQGPVSYRKVKPLKLKLLREAFAQFCRKEDARGTERARQYHEFIAENRHWLPDYALFRALMQIHGNLPVWEQWPFEHATPAEARKWMASRPAAEKQQLEEDLLFFSYVQWIARGQWKDLKQYGRNRGVALMGDIPFGIGRCSADVWANRSLFDLRWSCGAPPEKFFKEDLFTEKWGQNWGIPLYRWERMKEDNYAWWRARVQGVREIFHFFRIDHVLGFYRVYAFPWKPEDNGQYIHLSHDEARAKAGDLPRFWPGDDEDPHRKWVNQQQGEELLRMVLEASGDTGVVAEDLGMVPDYVRPSLTRLGIPGFKIPLFERHPDGSYRKSEEYEPLSVATLATHDHEPMAALWQRWREQPDGEREIRQLLQWIGWDPNHAPQELTPELHLAIARKLLASSSWLAVFMITDLFAQTQRFNAPGPQSESNWTERLPLSVNEFDRDPNIGSRIRSLEPHLTRN